VMRIKGSLILNGTLLGSSKSELVEVIPNSVNRKRGYLREASYLLLCFV